MGATGLVVETGRSALVSVRLRARTPMTTSSASWTRRDHSRGPAARRLPDHARLLADLARPRSAPRALGRAQPPSSNRHPRTQFGPAAMTRRTIPRVCGSSGKIHGTERGTGGTSVQSQRADRSDAQVRPAKEAGRRYREPVGWVLAKLVRVEPDGDRA